MRGQTRSEELPTSKETLQSLNGELTALISKLQKTLDRPCCWTARAKQHPSRADHAVTWLPGHFEHYVVECLGSPRAAILGAKLALNRLRAVPGGSPESAGPAAGARCCRG